MYREGIANEKIRTYQVRSRRIHLLYPSLTFKSVHLLGELQKAFVPVVGALMSGASGNEKMDLDKMLDSDLGANIGNALMKCTVHLDGKEMERLSRLILVNNPDTLFIDVSGKEPEQVTQNSLEIAFHGNVMGMFQLMGKVLEVNYQDFFQPLKAGFGKAMSALGQKSGN